MKEKTRWVHGAFLWKSSLEIFKVSCLKVLGFYSFLCLHFDTKAFLHKFPFLLVTTDGFKRHMPRYNKTAYSKLWSTNTAAHTHTQTKQLKYSCHDHFTSKSGWTNVSKSIISNNSLLSLTGSGQRLKLLLKFR